MSTNLEFTAKLNDLFSGKMSGMIKQTGSLEQAISGIGNKIAGAFAISKVVDFGKAVVDSLQNYEYFSASLKTLMHGDADAAKSLQSDLVKLAATTPFSLVEVQNATKQLMAYGFASTQVTTNIRMLGDVSAGVGAPLSEISYLYGTLKTSGKVMLKDMQQFAGRGIPIYESLAKVLHKNTSEIGNMVSAGKVGFKDIEKAFQSMTSEGGQFYKLMEDQSKTVGGKISNMGDSWEQLKVHIGQSQKGIIASTIDFASSLISSIDEIVNHGNKLDEVFKKYNLKGYASGWNIFSGKQENDYERGMYAEEEGHFSSDKERFSKMNIAGMSSKDYNNLLKIQQLGTENYLESIERMVNQNKDKFQTGDIAKFFAFAREENKQVLATLRQLRTATKKSDGAGGSTTADDLGTGTSVTGNRPQNLYINITKLVEKLVIETQNLTEAGPQVKALIAQYLLEAVNDINNMQR